MIKPYEIFTRTRFPNIHRWEPGVFDIETFDVIENQVLYLSIKGSDSIKNSLIDWLLNLLVIPCPSIAHKRLVHLGFLIRERRLYKKLLKRLKEVKPTKIYFGGHSMGATLAGLLQDRFSHYHNIPSEAFLYAPGRPWFLFRRKLNNTYAYRYGRDIVPLIVWPLRNFKYERIGKKGNPFTDHFPKNYREYFQKKEK